MRAPASSLGCRPVFERRWRLALFLLPACGGAWAAGCSDDASPTAGGPSPDASTPDSSTAPTDGGSEAGVGDCSQDLDTDNVWKHLECSGLYKDFSSKTVAEDVKPYAPGVAFWSDGAEKQRWVSMPSGAKIDITDFDEWVYPVGTKLWKEFKIGGKRIETRLLTKMDASSWGYATYRWNDDESDAVRERGGEKIASLGPDGGVYEIPDDGTCRDCHNGRKDKVLGFEAVNMGIASATGETLATLATEGRLSAAPPKTALAFPTTGAADKAPAAVGWLHANCGACHNGNVTALAQSRAHFLVKASQLAPADGGTPTLEQLDVWTQAYCKSAPRTEPDAGAPWMYLRPGQPARSEISALSGRRSSPDPDNSQMPPIVTRAVDTVGHTLLDDWITSLPPCP
jgi:hypothetical protein